MRSLFPDSTNTKVGTPGSPNYVYDFNGNMIYDASKKMRVTYDWRNMPIQYSFLKITGSVDIKNPLDVQSLATNTNVQDLVDVNMTYDAAGDRVKKETVDHTSLASGGGGLNLQIGDTNGTPITIQSNGDLSCTPATPCNTADGALEIDYMPDENTATIYAVLAANGGMQLHGTFSHDGDLSSKPAGALSFDICSPGADQTLPCLCIDNSGNMITAGQSLVGRYTSGAAYLNGSYVFTADSALKPYKISYAKIAGEGREDFSASGANARVFYYYLTDHLGSTRAVWSPDENKNIEALGYLPYGTEIPFGVQTAGEMTREKFTGKEHDKDGRIAATVAGQAVKTTGMGLTYFGKRYYDALSARWTCIDPDHQFKDEYAYGPDNPLNGSDSKGLIWKTTSTSVSCNVFNLAMNFTGSLAGNDFALDQIKEFTKPPNAKGEAAFGGVASLLSAITDPATIDGAFSRTVTQTWVHDPNNPEKDNTHPIGERRIIVSVRLTHLFSDCLVYDI